MNTKNELIAPVLQYLRDYPASSCETIANGLGEPLRHVQHRLCKLMLSGEVVQVGVVARAPGQRPAPLYSLAEAPSSVHRALFGQSAGESLPIDRELFERSLRFMNMAAMVLRLAVDENVELDLARDGLGLQLAEGLELTAMHLGRCQPATSLKRLPIT